MALSFVLSWLGTSSLLTEPGTFETTLVTVRNIFSQEGIRYIFSEAVNNFRLLEPLVIIIISLIAASMLELSGLLNHVFSGFKNVRGSVITFITIFISIISTVIGDHSYAILFPLVAVLYKIANRDPKLGIFTVFIGITVGYGAGIGYNYQDIVLSNLTETSALGIMNFYDMTNSSIFLISVAATVVLSIVGTILIERTLGKRARKETPEELNTSATGLKVTGLVFVILGLFIAYSVMPGLPFSGWLLDSNADTYTAQLFGANAPFREGFIVLFVLVSLICGAVYGRFSRNIKSGKEFNKAISESFKGTGFIFAGLFFMSIMLGILEWTNISTVLSLNLINMFTNTQMTGIFLITLLFVVTIIVTVLNPVTLTNWALISPTFVPLMMRANISPEFAQVIFNAGDSVGKSVTPLYVFLIVMIGFLYKYDTQGEDISLFGTMKKILPIVAWMTITWLIIIVGWNLLGFQLGFGTSSTL